MNTPEKVNCLIIGSGPAGFTAAIYAARADMKPVLYQGSQPGGQLMETTEVDNFPGYADGVNGPQMMIDLESQAKRFDTDVRSGWVTNVDFSGEGEIHKVWVGEGKDAHEIHANIVIISTGASAKWLGLESELRLRDIGGGVSACAVCDGFFYRGQDVVLVGAGDSACEEASYLAKLCNKVTMLVRKEEMRASKAMQNRVKAIDNIDIRYNTETVEVLGVEGVEGVRFRNNITGKEEELAITGFFVAIGHTPNTSIFANYLNLDDQGYIVQATPGTSLTNVEGVFWSGDCADKVYKQAVTAAGSGCMAALDAERYLAAKGVH
ncbi:MAG TPA: thioredoxin-disulfide reductase [Flavobacteriales bacterium]|jgi:thioredoxin reductase (NADPH)|nr:thioredoxin-disulfide reductase [Flavobacteriales bacterium]HIO16543.1 thioredoxin-disulfide reductase [Flavobacteriales bacterium]HIO60067.1 thioredoxin-disulfide reductase [Flavobacteriales bacterium]